MELEILSLVILESVYLEIAPDNSMFSDKKDFSNGQ